MFVVFTRIGIENYTHQHTPLTKGWSVGHRPSLSHLYFLSCLFHFVTNLNLTLRTNVTLPIRHRYLNVHTMSSSLSVPAKLCGAHIKLKRAADELLRQAQHIDREQWILRGYESTKLNLSRFSMASRLVYISCAATDARFLVAKLFQADERIVRIARTLPQIRQKPCAAERTFHCFQRLPLELRLMIWEAAAVPPPCVHYFSTYKLVPKGRLPAAYLMADGGLWTACEESRQVITRVYQKTHKHINTTGCSAATKRLEMHYRRLCRFNESAEKFKKLVCKLDYLFKRHSGRIKLEHLSAALDLYGIEPYTAKTEDGCMALTGVKMCKELRWEALFEPNSFEARSVKGGDGEGM